MLMLEDYLAGFRHAMANGGTLPASARMDIDGAGSIHIANGLATDSDGPADCVMRASHQTFDELYHGTLDPTIAFARGDLAINGDMAVAIATEDLFKKARAA